jgi:hypothetical protein
VAGRACTGPRRPPLHSCCWTSSGRRTTSRTTKAKPPSRCTTSALHQAGVSARPSRGCWLAGWLLALVVLTALVVVTALVVLTALVRTGVADFFHARRQEINANKKPWE